MRRLGIGSLRVAGWLALAAGSAGLQAEPQGEGTEFKEVYDLIRGHLEGVNEAELDRAAVQALVAAFSPKVSLVTNGAAGGGTDMPLGTKSSRFEGGLGYGRIGRGGEGVAQAGGGGCGGVGGG